MTTEFVAMNLSFNVFNFFSFQIHIIIVHTIEYQINYIIIICLSNMELVDYIYLIVDFLFQDKHISLKMV